jgi:hypothetical protein
MWKSLIGALVISACGSRTPPATGEAPAPGASSAGNRPTSAPPWQDRFDFTGDQVPDRIEVTFTGGGHCCYRLALIDGKAGARTELPFELDGGFVSELDLSQPERFAIEVDPSGVARMVLEIATYNGEPDALPRDGFKLGVTSHRIAVRFRGGMTVENLGWRCQRAMTAMRLGRWAAWEGLPVDCEVEAVLVALDATAAEPQPSWLGLARRPAVAHRAVRVVDDRAVVVYTAGPPSWPGPGDRPRVVRIDLADPAMAAAAATAWSSSTSQQAGDLSYWSVGLALAIGSPGGRPATLTLVPAGELRTFVQDLGDP